jgi:hypothetical protein
MPMRFYRILDEGQDGLANDEPIVSIISPTNGVAATGELAVTVVAATDQPIISGTELYVDGQEVLPANITTNYTDGSTNYEEDTYYINTCEWLNQTHTLFATAQSASGLGEAVGSPNVLIGHGVSPFVPILFSNLITEISFSQPQFNPSLGETQQVGLILPQTVIGHFKSRMITATSYKLQQGAEFGSALIWIFLEMVFQRRAV